MTSAEIARWWADVEARRIAYGAARAMDPELVEFVADEVTDAAEDEGDPFDHYAELRDEMRAEK